MGLLDSFGFDPNDPRKAALLQMGLGLLASREKLPQALGQAGLMGVNAYHSTKGLNDRRAEEAQQREQRGLLMEQMKRQLGQQKSMDDLASRAFGPNPNLVQNDDMGNAMPQAPGGGGFPEYARGMAAINPMQALAMQTQLAALQQKERVKVAPGETLGSYEGNKFVPAFTAPDKPPAGYTRGADGNLVPDQNWLDSQMRLRNAGAARVQTNVNSFTPASEEAQKEFMKSTRLNYEALRNAPVALENIEKAKAEIPKAKEFMGPGGSGMLNAVKFLNNRMGLSVKTEGVKSAEELRTRVFQNVLDNLKKMDAQPSEMQQKVMMDALGSLETDPGALPAVLDAFGDVIRSKVEIHNREVSGATQRGVKFPYNPIIEMRRGGGSGDPLVLEVGGQQVRFPSEAALRAYKKQVGMQ